MRSALLIAMFAAPVAIAGAVAVADWITDRWLTWSYDRRAKRRAYFTDAWSRRNES